MSFQTPKLDWKSHNACATADFIRIEENILYNYKTFEFSGSFTVGLAYSNFSLQKIPFSLDTGERLTLKRASYYIANGSNPAYTLSVFDGVSSVDKWSSPTSGRAYGDEALDVVLITATAPTAGYLEVYIKAGSTSTDDGDGWFFEVGQGDV